MSDDPLYATAAEPERLGAFIAEIEAAGFERVNEIAWSGPTYPPLIDASFTDADRMTLLFRHSWPYRAPLLNVPGISAWHADRELLCLWRDDDNSQRWATLQGLYDRIDEWIADANTGFAAVENARNPEIYWQEDGGRVAGLVDLEELLGGQNTDGQHGEFHFIEATSLDGRPCPVNVFDLYPGAFTAMTPRPSGASSHDVRGRWFYRAQVSGPPRNLDELRSLLTERQRDRLDKDLRDRPLVMYGLVWRNRAGLVATMLLSQRVSIDERKNYVVALRPKGRVALLLRAGPDAQDLQRSSIAIIGVGAIGSHVADALARAGTAQLVLRDYDLLFPANLGRHAAPPGTPAGTAKTRAMAEQLSQYPWVDVDVPDDSDEEVIWSIDSIRSLLVDNDLVIDATGHGGLAELAGRIASDLNRPFISVALFRAGTVVRVRRQADGDMPLLRRPLLDLYPEIAPLPDELEYVGTEVGCLAQIHNAPPTAVMQAAVLAAEVAIDLLTGRLDQPDEIIEVLRIGDPPFHRLGRLRQEELPVTLDITERVQAHICERARRALPNETGGVLIGCHIDERPIVTEAPEHRDPNATPCSFRLPVGETKALVENARASDERLGYLGDWHSHPSGVGPSDLDTASMLSAARDSGQDRPILLLAMPGEHDSVDLKAYVTSPAGLTPATICTTGDLPETDAAT